MTLKEGQYQIGNLVFGAQTMYTFSAIEATGYGSTVGDVPIPRSDEIRFRKDYLVPSTLLITLGVIDNYMLDGSAAPWQNGETLVEALAKEWRADDIRKIWGYTKPLIYRRNDATRRVYGRPRDFSVSTRRKKLGWYDVVMNYQRVDSVVYDDLNTLSSGLYNTNIPVVRGTNNGDGPTWMELYITGPIASPQITIGTYTIKLAYTLAAGEVLQINSYPWERRVVSSNSQNLAAKLTQPYLDELVLPPGCNYTAKLSGTGATAATKLDVLWRNAWLVF